MTSMAASARRSASRASSGVCLCNRGACVGVMTGGDGCAWRLGKGVGRISGLASAGATCLAGVLTVWAGFVTNRMQDTNRTSSTAAPNISGPQSRSRRLPMARDKRLSGASDGRSRVRGAVCLNADAEKWPSDSVATVTAGDGIDSSNGPSMLRSSWPSIKRISGIPRIFSIAARVNSPLLMKIPPVALAVRMIPRS